MHAGATRSGLRLGLSGPAIPTDPSGFDAERIALWRSHEVDVITTHFAPPPEDVTSRWAARLRPVLADAGIRIAQAHAYNPVLVHPDESVRSRELDRLGRAFEAAHALSAEAVLSGCGSLNPARHYAPDPRNHHEDTIARLVDSLVRAADMAAQVQIVFTLECHVLTTLSDPHTIRRILDEVDSPWIKANYDPVNMLGSASAVYASGTLMREMRQVVGDRYGHTAHAKDVVVVPGLVTHIDEAVPFEGLLDWDAYLSTCVSLAARPAVLVEHLPAEIAIPTFDRFRAWVLEQGVEVVGNDD